MEDGTESLEARNGTGGQCLQELRPRLEAEAVWLCSPGQVGDRKDSALGVLQKGKGDRDCWRADRARAGCTSTAAFWIPARPVLLNISAWKTDALADPVDAKSLASRICYPEFPERPLLGALHTQRPTALLSLVPGSTHPCCFCSDQTCSSPSSLGPMTQVKPTVTPDISWVVMQVR